MCDLGFTLNTELYMHRHVNKVIVSTCFHHIRCLKQVHRLVGHEVTLKLVFASILVRVAKQ